MKKNQDNVESERDRRSFCSKIAAGILGGTVLMAPIAIGIPVVIDPLLRKKKGVTWISVANEKTIPSDGTPLKIPIIMDMKDAWVTRTDYHAGTIYLRRDSKESTILALQSICPHLGCHIDYDESASSFICPCHQSLFTKSGQRTGKRNLAPRDMDKLPVQIRDGIVHVEFKKFRLGRKSSIPIT